MKLLKATALSIVTCAFSGTAMSDEQITVQSLLAKQFATVGAHHEPSWTGAIPTERGLAVFVFRLGDAKLTGSVDSLLQAGPMTRCCGHLFCLE